MLRKISRYCTGLWSRFTPLTNQQVTPPAPVMRGPAVVTITTIGTVIFEKKARFYGIRTDSGTQYLPFNLQDFPDCLKKGLRVHFTAELYPEIPSFRQWGTTVRLLNLNPAP